MPTRILGISAYYHDSAACLVEDGRIVAAAQEERFTRKKHDASFPSNAVAYCLREGGITLAQLDLAGFYEKPLLKFERLLETYTASAPRGLRSYLMAMPLWLGGKLWVADEIKFRESFRPFAPLVLRERVGEWFDLEEDSSYMLLVAEVRREKRIPVPAGADALTGIDKLNVPRSTVPAITHVDYSARIQTVRPEIHGLYYDIIEAFYRLTGCPVIVNTSFNYAGSPSCVRPRTPIAASCARIWTYS